MDRPIACFVSEWRTQCPKTAWGRSQDSSDDIAASHGFDGRGSIPSRDTIFLFLTASKLDLGPTHSPIQWVSGALPPGVERLGSEADHSPQSSAEVKNYGAIPPYVSMT
jgi:hypothetical protein